MSLSCDTDDALPICPIPLAPPRVSALLPVFFLPCFCFFWILGELPDCIPDVSTLLKGLGTFV